MSLGSSLCLRIELRMSRILTYTQVSFCLSWYNVFLVAIDLILMSYASKKYILTEYGLDNELSNSGFTYLTTQKVEDSDDDMDSISVYNLI